MAGRGVVGLIVQTLPTGLEVMLKSISVPGVALAKVIAALRLPVPLSLVLVTMTAAEASLGEAQIANPTTQIRTLLFILASLKYSPWIRRRKDPRQVSFDCSKEGPLAPVRFYLTTEESSTATAQAMEGKVDNGARSGVSSDGHEIFAWAARHEFLFEDGLDTGKWRCGVPAPLHVE